MRVAVRSGAVALVAAAVTAGVLAVTGASGEQEAAVASSTTTTMTTQLEPIELNDDRVPFSCREGIFAVLAPVDAEKAYEMAALVGDQIGHPVYVIDRSACSNRGSESSPGSSTEGTTPDGSENGESEEDESASDNSGNSNADSKEANQDDQIEQKDTKKPERELFTEDLAQQLDPIVNLMAGPFGTKEAACEVKQSITTRLNEPMDVNEEMVLEMKAMTAWIHVSRPGSGDPAADSSLIIDCVETTESSPGVPAPRDPVDGD